MSYSENSPPASFRSKLEAIFKKYPFAQKDIERLLAELISNPLVGDVIPGFSQNQVRKIRIPLKKYGIGKSKGLRLIFLVNPVGKKITKLHIYAKMQYKGEAEVIASVKNALKELLGESPLPLG